MNNIIKFLKLLIPSKYCIKSFFYILPSALVGLWLFPTTVITYPIWLIICILILILMELFEIHDTLKK